MKSMPLIGKSEKFRSAALRLIFELVSWEELEAEGAGLDWNPWAFFVSEGRAAESVCCVVIVEREKRGRVEVICK